MFFIHVFLDGILVEYWGVKHPLPYNDPGNVGETMLLGANFASGGAGILNDTGRVFVWNNICIWIDHD